MAMIKFPTPRQWMRKADKLFEDREIKIWGVYDKAGIWVADVIGDMERDDFDLQFILAKQWVMTPRKSSAKSATQGYLGESLWTCNCEKDFVQHRWATSCWRCKTAIQLAKDRLKRTSELFKWDLILDASQYELPPGFKHY